MFNISNLIHDTVFSIAMCDYQRVSKMMKFFGNLDDKFMGMTYMTYQPNSHGCHGCKISHSSFNTKRMGVEN